MTPRALFHALLLLAAILCGAARAADADPAAGLRAKYTELGPQLASNPFQRPLVLDSKEERSRLSGDIFAVVNYPYATVASALNDATHWCDILILHLNTKFCRMQGTPDSAALQVAIGKKADQPVEDAYKVDFAYRAGARGSDFFQVELSAQKGPLGTSNYRIVLEAVSLPGNRTFIHLAYSYGYNFGASIAMQGYLSTVGRDKVGFTRLGAGYIGGMRGVVERNTMRYYLAIDAYLAGLSAPPAQRLDKRLQAWFNGTERYARQLHEIDRETYMTMKRAEVARQQGVR
jgi:hypothetical protein